MAKVLSGFCDATYQFQDRWAAVERSVNYYPIPIESPGEQPSRMVLESSPCNQPFGTLPVVSPFNQPNRGMLEYRGLAYGVNGTEVFSLDQTGAYKGYGSVFTDGQPVCMAANANGQIFIASSGFGYVLATDQGTLTQITTADFLGASYATFQDGYAIVITPGTNQFQISGDANTPVGDFTLWDAANISFQGGQADRLRVAFSRREYLRLLGFRRSQIYYNSGALNFPFVSYNSTFIETGISAPFSLVDLGDALMWVGENDRGNRACWRDAAFQPQRVSNFAVEQWWESYPTISDAVSFAYIWKGHLMYQITFPQAEKTWVYDDTASRVAGRSLWHERQFLSPDNVLTRRPELFHCFAFGKHLVASDGTDGNPGAVYQYADSPYADCCQQLEAQVQQPLVSERISPHVTQTNNRIIYNSIEFELNKGGGGSGDVPAPATSPNLMLRWSDDGGNTWSPEYTIPMGQVGQYGIRAIMYRCGYGRNRVFWVRVSDPVARGLVAAYLNAAEVGS